MTKPIESACPKCGALIPEDAPHGLCPKCVLAGADTVLAPSPAPGLRTSPPTVVEVAAQFPDLEIGQNGRHSRRVGPDLNRAGEPGARGLATRQSE